MFDRPDGAPKLVVQDEAPTSADESSALGGLLTEHAPRIIEFATKRPEVVAVGAVALVAYKRHAGFRNFINRLVGGGK